MLGPADIGHRVVVRRVVGVRDDRPLLTDALGVLTSITTTDLTIRTGTGASLTIARRSVVAAKRVPPPPPRRPGHG